MAHASHKDMRQAWPPALQSAGWSFLQLVPHVAGTYWLSLYEERLSRCHMLLMLHVLAFESKAKCCEATCLSVVV